MAARFSMDDSVRFGWRTTLANLPFFICLILLLTALGAIEAATVRAVRRDPMAQLVVNLAWSAVGALLTMGLIRIVLRFCDGQRPGFGDLFSCVHLLIAYLVSGLVFGLIVMLGIILFIVPGIIWALKFQFFSYFIVDRELGPIEALRASARITRGAKLDLFVFVFLLLGVNLLGLLCLGVGLFITIPLSMLAMAHVYRQLLQAYGHEYLASWVCNRAQHGHKSSKTQETAFSSGLSGLVKAV